MHAPLDLPFVPEVSLQLPALRLSALQLLTLLTCLAKLPSAPSSNHASGMTLDHDALLQQQRRLICAAEVRAPWLHDDIIAAVNIEAHLLHLSAIIPLALCGAGAVLVRLSLSMKADDVYVFFLDRSSLSDCMMVRCAVLFVPIAAKVWLFHDRPLHMDRNHPLLSTVVHHFQLQTVWHNILLCRLLLVVIDSELNPRAIPRLQSQVPQGALIR
mmetsp:Transcript_117863/g.279688  ORF Transcript_117863/g.279688 Transcript_117863/m.279688 type:complete len:214 (+) Transcript_117863:696-1337(+)